MIGEDWHELIMIDVDKRVASFHAGKLSCEFQMGMIGKNNRGLVRVNQGRVSLHPPDHTEVSFACVFLTGTCWINHNRNSVSNPVQSANRLNAD